jgi:hypothetical protein
MEKKVFSSIGKIIKKERLVVSDRSNDKSTLIFETEHPFAGYYGHSMPEKTDPNSLFLVTKHHYNDDRVLRAIRNIKKDINYCLDATPGIISFANKEEGAIRIRCISYTIVSELISSFNNEGIEFMPKQKYSPSDSLIILTKYFDTEEVEEGIFIDRDSKEFAYLQIPKHFGWNSFEKATQQVRNNVDDIYFDAGMATMYDKSGVLDLVRIYSEKRSVENLRVIRKKYLDVLAKL